MGVSCVGKRDEEVFFLGNDGIAGVVAHAKRTERRAATEERHESNGSDAGRQEAPGGARERGNDVSDATISGWREGNENTGRESEGIRAQEHWRGSVDGGEWETESRIRRVSHDVSQGMDKNRMNPHNGGHEELSILRRDSGTQENQRSAGGQRDICSSQVLQQNVHGFGLHQEIPDEIGNPEALFPSEEDAMRELYEFKGSLPASRRRGLDEQRSIELKDAVQFVSYAIASRKGRHHNTQREAAMQRLWKSFIQAFSLQYPSDTLQAAWISLSCEETDWVILAACQGRWVAEWPGVARTIGSEKGRVDRLKQLGNAVVPQQIYPILQGIADITRAMI